MNSARKALARSFSQGSLGSAEKSGNCEIPGEECIKRPATSRSYRFIKGTNITKPPNNDGEGILAMLLHPLCILLLCTPVGIAAYFLDWGAPAIFWLNFLGLIPLAKILGDATEELAANLHNDMLAGLLNATFGNAVEVVMMVQTLRAGLIGIVKATLLGSVLSNLLLVLGCAFFFGGIVSKQQSSPNVDDASKTFAPLKGAPARENSVVGEMEFVGEKVQTYPIMTAMLNMSLLLLSCLSLSLNTVFFSEYAQRNEEMADVVLSVSRNCSVAMMIAYVGYVYFQLVTHRGTCQEDEGEEEEDEPTLSLHACILSMLAVTLIIAISSELLVESLGEVVQHSHISSSFIGVILLPIVGNACEHASAIRFAVQDKPGLSIGIAVGSSTQIALFVVPLSVIMGWWLDQPMDLNFGSLNSTVIIIGVVVVLSIVVDGSATWLQGYLLMTAYWMVGVLYWHLPDKMSEFS